MLYGTECLALNRKGQLETLQKRKTNSQKLLGLVQNSDETRLQRTSNELCRNVEEIPVIKRKRRLKLTGHHSRLSTNRCAKKIVDHTMKMKASMYDQRKFIETSKCSI